MFNESDCSHVKVTRYEYKQQNSHLVVFPREHLNSHNGKDEPEDQTYHQHIKYAGYGLDKCIDDNLKKDSVRRTNQDKTRQVVRHPDLNIMHFVSTRHF